MRKIEKSVVIKAPLEKVLTNLWRITLDFKPTICNIEAEKATERSPLRSPDPDGIRALQTTP